MRTIKLLCFIIIGIALLYSCSNTKHLPTGEILYTGANVKVDAKGNVKPKSIRNELEGISRPKPNRKFLGMRMRLWFYNVAGEDANKGIKKWIKTKLGEPPVLLSDADPYLISDLMKARLNNMGYFVSKVDHEVNESGQKAEINYLATVSTPYVINEVRYPDGNDSLSVAIRKVADGSLIKQGNRYDLDLLIDERARVDSELKNIGYFYFNPDLLVFKADTTVGSRQINLLLDVKPDAPAKALSTYTLNRIFVIPGYSLTRKSRQPAKDTVYDYNYYFVERTNNFKHKSLNRYIRLKEGDLYSKNNHNLTISRLMAMGVFKFVNIKFNDTVIDGRNLLDAEISLTQLLPKTLKVDFDVSTKSNNYTGPALRASFTNRNLFRGAELLILTFNGAYETQLNGPQKGFNSWEAGAGITLITPRFLTPIRIKHESTLNVPKTKFDVNFTLLHRVQYFDMLGLNFTYGYIWRDSERSEYEVNPVAINFAKLQNKTAAFDSVLRRNPYLRRSFEEQFTFGSTASYTYNTLTGLPKDDQYYFKVMLDVSGNLLSLAHRTFTGEASTDERPYKIFNSRFSQYSKISTDSRYYRNFSRESTFATRIILGAGIPYGNSLVMPYSKQFFSGGANSVRAFLPRSLGPGSYNIPDSIGTGYFDQSGDIRIELNAEYRFKIVSVLRGAIFTDAGNIWLMRENEYLPGGKFEANKFMKEIAIGSGLGLRVDLSFFLIRVDVAMPLRKPYRPENERWVFDEINFGSGKWRRENLIFNIAVGYPF